VSVSCTFPYLVLEDGETRLCTENYESILTETGYVPMVQQGGASARKLKCKLGSCSLAVLLVNSGFSNPAKIRVATDGQLTTAGVTAEELILIREVY